MSVKGTTVGDELPQETQDEGLFLISTYKCTGSEDFQGHKDCRVKRQSMNEEAKRG